MIRTLIETEPSPRGTWNVEGGLPLVQTEHLQPLRALRKSTTRARTTITEPRPLCSLMECLHWRMHSTAIAL